jgi:hypothetical protein
MTAPTLKALAAEQAHLKRRIDAQAIQIRRLQELAHTLAQAHERMRLELDLAMGYGAPETDYDRCLFEQRAERTAGEAWDRLRRQRIRPVPSPQEAS